MKRLMLGSLLLIGACGQSPSRPQPIDRAVDLRPQHHNIPATGPDGTLWYLCETQPRTYTNLDRRIVVERDHYIQRTQCPKEPIE
jgi:hypothetical protein